VDFNRRYGKKSNALVGLRTELPEFWDEVERVIRMYGQD